MKIIGHIPDAFAKLVLSMILEQKVLQIIVKLYGKHRGAPVITWMPSGEIGVLFLLYLGIPCICFLDGAKIVHEEKVDKMKEISCFEKRDSFILLE